MLFVLFIIWFVLLLLVAVVDWELVNCCCCCWCVLFESNKIVWEEVRDESICTEDVGDIFCKLLGMCNIVSISFDS